MVYWNNLAAKCGNLEESKKYTASIDVRQLVIELNATSTVVEIAGGAQQSINITFKDFKVTDLNLDYHYAKIVLDKSPDDVFDPLLEFVQFTLQAIFKDKMLEYVEPYMKPKIQALIDSKMPVTFEGKNWPIPMQEE